MRAPFTGNLLVGVVLIGLLLVSCRLSWLGGEERDFQSSGPAKDWEVSWQQAEIERIVEAELAGLTQTAVSLPAPSQTGFPPVSPTPEPTGVPSPLPSATPESTQTSSLVPTQPLLPDLTPSASPISLPDSARLSGLTHLYQNMNNCGPATLAMALSYWGWPPDLESFQREGRQRDLQDVIALALKPEPQDKSVGPHELAAFIDQATPLRALVRSAGNLDLLKNSIAAGLPVIVQRGLDSYVWMGHYQLVSGYEQARQIFYVYDSYLGPSDAIPIPYQEFLQDWRAFNYTYLILFPPERELDLGAILGSALDLDQNRLSAAELARNELPGLGGRDLFFGWYNLGTSLVELEDFQVAAEAFDQAFALYDQLSEDKRPWRMLWYQTAPYQAYYATARYADLEALASHTIDAAFEPAKPGGPFIEESFYWRGMAFAAQGRVAEAVGDFQKACELNPLFEPAAEELRRLGGD